MNLPGRYGVCLIAAIAGFAARGSAFAREWPDIGTPPGATGFSIGESLTKNGLAMRVKGFLSKEMSIAAAADWYRLHLGMPLVETTFGERLILGREQDGYYLTVQLVPLGARGGSKGLLAVSDVLTLNRGRERYIASNESWLRRWPAGSRLIGHMTSDDDGKTSSYVLLRNGHDESLNAGALVRLMVEDGYVLEREARVDTSLAAHLRASRDKGTTYFFRGKGKEAVAIVMRDPEGSTSIVLNTVTLMDTYKK